MSYSADEFEHPVDWIAADNWASKHNDSQKDYHAHMLLRAAFMAGCEYMRSAEKWRAMTQPMDDQIARMANHPNPPKPITVYFGPNDINPSLVRDKLAERKRAEERQAEIAKMSDYSLDHAINVFSCMDQWKHSSYVSELQIEKQRREASKPQWATCGMCSVSLEPITYNGDWALCGICVAHLCAGGECGNCHTKHTQLYGDIDGPRYCGACFRAKTPISMSKPDAEPTP